MEILDYFSVSEWSFSVSRQRSLAPSPSPSPQTQKQFLTQSQPLAPAPAPSSKRKFPNRAKRWTIKREPSSFGRKSADPDGSGVRVAWETKSRKPRRKAKLRV